MRRLLAFAVLAAFVSPLAAAADAPSAPPLRSLVYDVAYSAHSKHEKKTSGFNGAYGPDPGGAPSTSGSGTAAIAVDGSDAGRLTIDVMEATKDAGLIVEAQYTSKLSNQPKMRIAVFGDGRLLADPNRAIDPTVLHILPLLARGFIAARELRGGTTWTMNAPPPVKGSTVYRVTSLDGQDAMLAFEGSFSLSGANGFDETDRGTTRYATDLVVPLSYDVSAHIRRQISIDESVTTDAHTTVTLVSDVITKKVARARLDDT